MRAASRDYEALRDRVLARYPKQVSIDFETYSDADLKQVGGRLYAKHPSTEVLLLSYSFDVGRTVHRWEYGDGPPDDLLYAVRSGYTIRAWNASFEDFIWRYVCSARMGWPAVPQSQFLDTAAVALSLALPPSLEQCAKALRLPVKKNPEGKKLIRKFCMPRKPTVRMPWTRIYPHDEPQAFDLFGDYCDDDVRVECMAFVTMPRHEIAAFDKPIYEHNQLLNERGIMLDRAGFTAIQRMIDYYYDMKTRRLQEITGGALQTDGQRVRFLEWSASQGYVLAGFKKEDIANALKDDVPDVVREALEIRQELSQVSTKKYLRMGSMADPDDDRVRDNLLYHRATTGRNGGSGLQLHNFPRDYVSKDPAAIQACIDFIGREDYEAVEVLYGPLLDVAKGLLRPMVMAPPGKTFFVADFSGVENRGTAWVARDPVALKVFADGIDEYIDFAAKQFGIDPSDVSDEQRTAAKATILGGMFGAGWKTIYETNVQRGIPMTVDEAKTNVKDLRRIRKVTAKTWYDLANATKEVFQKNADVVYKGLRFGRRGEFLFIKLPSGRALAYYDPKLEYVKTPWGDEILQVTYMGLTPQKQWIRMSLTPSRLIENIVSAICRDLLLHGQLLIEADGRVTPVLNVHDEVVSEGEPGAIELDEYCALLTTLPDWATTETGIAFPLEAEGYVSVRYKK